MMITSLTNQKVKDLCRLHQRKYRKETYLLYDQKMIDKALEYGLVKMLIKKEGSKFEYKDEIIVSHDVMAKISEGKDITEVAECYIKKDVIKKADRLILLDDLADPQNIGMIIDTASIFGFDGVILSENSADIYNEKCLEAAGNSFFDMKIVRQDLDMTIKDLKDQGLKVLATGLYNETKDLYDTKAPDRYAIIMGNEGHGIKERYYMMADEVIKIPMANIDSLNVAVAASIVMEWYTNSAHQSLAHQR